MSLIPDLTPLVNKITEFTHAQNQNQQQIIALLKQVHFELAQIKTHLQTK